MNAAQQEYGGALFSLAQEQHLEDNLLEGLACVCDMFAAHRDYLRLLENPAVRQEERLALLDEAFRGAVHPYVLNFLKILCEKRALRMLPGCAEEYRTRLYEARGILPVTAITAVPLSAQQSDALRAKLQQATGKTVQLSNALDETLLGGVKLRYAGKELDGTVLGRLDGIRAALLAQ